MLAARGKKTVGLSWWIWWEWLYSSLAYGARIEGGVKCAVKLASRFTAGDDMVGEMMSRYM